MAANAKNPTQAELAEIIKVLTPMREGDVGMVATPIRAAVLYFTGIQEDRAKLKQGDHVVGRSEGGTVRAGLYLEPSFGGHLMATKSSAQGWLIWPFVEFCPIDTPVFEE